MTFTCWLKATGITAREVNNLTGTQMASHYLCTNPDGQCAVPTPDMFDKLRASVLLETVPRRIMNIVYR